MVVNHPNLILLAIPAAFAWGPDGHASVADIAAKSFNDNANKAVADIMGEGTRLADYSTWADSIRYGPDKDKWRWTSGLHYADVDNCEFVYAHDCKNDYCVVGAIKNYTRQVADKNLSLDQRQIALKFLTHFIGDVHQPLHVDRHSDLGGNTVHVDYEFADDKNTPLHKVWDEKLIDEFEGSHYGDEYIQQDFNYDTPVADRDIFWGITVEHIEKELANGGAFHQKIPKWLEDCEKNGLDECVNSMASESAILACNDAYKHVDGREVLNKDVLPMDYYTNRIDVVKEQLAKAAVRFAWVMNNAFSKTTTVFAPISCT